LKDKSFTIQKIYLLDGKYLSLRFNQPQFRQAKTAKKFAI